MDSKQEKVIELSKKKIALGIVGAALFVAAGVWLLTNDSESIRTGSGFRLLFNSPAVAYGLGLAAVVVFGLLGLSAVKQLFNRKPGLVFNRDGIVDNASAVAAGFIPWSEILGSQVFEMQKQKMLVILVRDPQKYVDRGSAIKRKMNQLNYQMAGSPITISSVVLKANFAEICSVFDEYQRKYGNVAD